MTEKVAGQEVVVEWTKKDQYGRILGEVRLGKRHINLELVQDGLAWHYKQYSKSKELAEAEDAARKAKKRLWADKESTPPWDFRKAEREASKSKKRSDRSDHHHSPTDTHARRYFQLSSTPN